MGKVPCLEKVFSCFIDHRLTSFREGDLAANHIANARTNVVMHSQVGVWGERNFGSSQFVLTVKLNQMAENNLFKLDGRRPG